ncbi:MAG: (2Fe-2S)-binding protein [Deltaproteobacteria bacterium]|nr:(2Fe-2S)-binding protein [Deltaproteobacteria bacterium]
MPKLTIDGKEYEVPAGTSVIKACHENGIDIPHYCYHPGLSPEGNCRLCLVEIEKMPKLAPSCTTVAGEGMIVRTNTDKVKKARADVMEFLLVDHPIDCPICDQVGECKLQDYYMEHDRRPSHVPLEQKILKPKRVQFSDKVIYDAERCILCTRCVRFCREVPGTNELGMFNRGAVSLIGLNEGRQLANDYSMNVVDVCPVGALTSASFRFQKRVYFLKTTPSVCNGCSRGCNINLDWDNEKLFRYRPRPNLEVNDYWMCDAGRLSCASQQAEGRLLRPKARMAGELKQQPWGRILDRVAEALRSAGDGKLAVLLSARATTEENYAWRSLIQSRFPKAFVAFTPADFYAEGKGDDILITADKSPNQAAGDALGLRSGSSLEQIVQAMESGQIATLVVLDDDYASSRNPNNRLADRFRAALAKVAEVVAVTPHESETTRLASVIVPKAAFTETTGTFINVDRRVQRIARSVPPPGEALEGLDIVSRLAHLLGTETASGNAAATFARMTASDAAFRGLTWEGLGEQGALLAS